MHPCNYVGKNEEPRIQACKHSTCVRLTKCVNKMRGFSLMIFPRGSRHKGFGSYGLEAGQAAESEERVSGGHCEGDVAELC